MRKMRKIKIIVGIIFVLLFISCDIFAQIPPYAVSGEMVLDNEEYEGEALFEFDIYNKSDKTIEEFTIVFYLFDEDGNTPLTGRSNIVSKIKATVEPYESFESSFSLMKFLTVIPEYPYSVDYLYLSRITYSDGSVWSDPIGMKFF